MSSRELNVVTGSFGYTGKYVTRLLLARGKRVLTLTGHPERFNPFGDRVSVAPFNFDNPPALAQSLRGATTLYNTYWVRFAHGGTTFDRAVDNTKILIDAARRAGVRRIVHVSITNPSEESSLPYFRGKALLERAVIESGLSYAIIRPTVIFGREDILINNIAFLLRQFPVFIVPGSGDYGLQPIHVEDMAKLAVTAGHSEENLIIDAVGPDVYTFDELVRLIAEKTHSPAKIIHLDPQVVLFLSKLIGWLVRDVVLTRDEVDGLMANLLVSDKPPTGSTRLGDFLERHGERLGSEYSSELSRHYHRAAASPAGC